MFFFAAEKISLSIADINPNYLMLPLVGSVSKVWLVCVFLSAGLVMQQLSISIMVFNGHGLSGKVSVDLFVTAIGDTSCQFFI